MFLIKHTHKKCPLPTKQSRHNRNVGTAKLLEFTLTLRVAAGSKFLRF